MDADTKSQIEALARRVQDLERGASRVPVRNAIGNGGGGGFAIKHYELFPAIPDVPTVIDCQGQLWFANADSTYWKPCVEFTSATGAPGT